MYFRCSFLREIFSKLDFIDICFKKKKKKFWVAVFAGTILRGVLSELGFYVPYLARLASATSASKLGMKDSIMEMALFRRPRAGT
jgi:hypothetical protein